MYEAKVRTQGTDSPVFLVMQAGITSVPGGKTAVVGRDIASSSDNDWTTMTLAAGNSGGTRLLDATLQPQTDGPGTVLIDDIRLINRQVY